MYLLKSMFAGNVGTKPTSLKPVASPHTKQPTTIPAGDVPPTNTGKTVTTYNSQFIAQNESITEPLKNFSNALGKKIMTKTSRNAQANKKRKKRDQSSGTLFKMIHPAKFLTVQGVLTQPVVLDKAAGTKAPQTASLIAQAVKPITTRPDDQIVSATSKPVNKPIQPTIDQGQIKSEIISPAISNKLPISNAQPEKDKDIGKMQVSDKASVSESPKTLETNKTAITSKAITDQKSGQEAASEMHAGDSKISIASEKPLTIGKSAVAASSRTHTSNEPAIITRPIANPADGRESIHETHSRGAKMTITGEKPVMTDEPALPLLDTETTVSTKPVITPTFPSNQQNQQSGKESTPNKADTDQKDHRGKTELFELSEKNGVQVGNLSVKSIAQKMNPQRTQLSATQIENHNNLLSNHGSNPDMEQGEQVLVGANAQPVITEPSPASATFAKIAGNADSGASVSSQIQESIHSSFHSGSQQIVIRLNPPELGKVTIKFTEQGDDITGLLQVDKLQTRDQIQQVLPEIIQNLQNSGIAIKKLEVVLTNQQEQYTSKDQSSTAGQDSFSGQQSSPNPESQGNNTTYNQWLTDDSSYAGADEPQGTLITNNRINMLI